MFEQVAQGSRIGKAGTRLILIGLPLSLLAIVAFLVRMIAMPLASYNGPLPPLTSNELATANRLEKHVTFLSNTIGARNIRHPGSLEKARAYFTEAFKSTGLTVSEQTFTADGDNFSNLEVLLPGSDPHTAGTVVIGAHYDTAGSGPGADDNATGVAAILELASQLPKSPHRQTIRMVLFANEEPPYFQTSSMGSLIYAHSLSARHIAVTAMLSLEMLGYYSDAPNTQQYPLMLGLFYPNKANFICFVANSDSRTLVRQAITTLRQTTQFPSEGIAAPSDMEGVGWSDHWSFWQAHYPAIMITDTSFLRYSAYHTKRDRPTNLNFNRMARVVEGTRRVILSLAN